MFSADPRYTPSARLLRALHYDEAQEIATSGAKVLHPRCILPARQYRIPLHVYATQAPEMPGTVLGAEGADGGAQVKAVCTKKGITLVALESPGMWHQVGFLADAFQIFKQHGMSVDLVSTSETNVTVSLDPAANTLDNTRVAELVADLSRLCRVQVIGPCASVSLVGRNIRAILHQLGGAFEFFEEQKIYLVSQAANDLNFTFVVDENQGNRLVEQLHELLDPPGPRGPGARPHLAAAVRARPRAGAGAPAVVAPKRAQLLESLGEADAAFVYDLDMVRAAARALRQLSAISRVHYSMKANPHCEILAALRAEGIDFECVARGEVERLRAQFPDLEPAAHPLHAELRLARGARLGAAKRRARHRGQQLHARELAAAVRRPGHLRAPRHRRRPRSSRSRAHRRHALQVRRAALGSAHARGPGAGGRRAHRRVCRRTSAAASSTSPAGNTPRACWRRRRAAWRICG